MGNTYHVYILSSRGGVLYIGVTRDLSRRLRQHKEHAIPGFTARYNVDRLIYFETTVSILEAIRREKQLKGWRREKKERLIATRNPEWKDLSIDWVDGW